VNKCRFPVRLGDQFFFKMASNICGSSIWNLLYVSFLAPIILRWLLDLGENMRPLRYNHQNGILNLRTRLEFQDSWRVSCIHTKIQHYEAAVIIAANWKCAEKLRQECSLQYRLSFKCCASLPFVTDVSSCGPAGDGTRNHSHTDPALSPAT
jgi:hypothetical protein